MNNFIWSCDKFSQLDSLKIYELIKLRVNVFVVEQNCPYPELDDKDIHAETRHLTAYNNSQLFAYARLLPAGVSYPEVSIGRFAVEESVRRQGLGSLLMEKSLNEITHIWPNSKIRMSAQTYLKDFYEKFGFSKVSDEYLEDGIPHIEMLREILD